MSAAEARPTEPAAEEAAGSDDEADDDLLEKVFSRWPLPHLRRQLLATRSALAASEARCVASAHAAGAAQETLASARLDSAQLKATADLLRRELHSTEEELAEEREPWRAAAAKRSEADVRVDELRGRLNEAMAQLAQARKSASGSNSQLQAAYDREHATAVLEIKRRVAAEAARHEMGATLEQNSDATREALARFRERLEGMHGEMATRAHRTASSFDELSQRVEELQRGVTALAGKPDGIVRIAGLFDGLRDELRRAAMQADAPVPTSVSPITIPSAAPPAYPLIPSPEFMRSSAGAGPSMGAAGPSRAPDSPTLAAWSTPSRRSAPHGPSPRGSKGKRASVSSGASATSSTTSVRQVLTPSMQQAQAQTRASAAAETLHLRRELKSAREEARAANTQLSRSQALVTKYQHAIVGLQAAQTEREAVQAEQMQASFDSRVAELRASIREELRPHLEAADAEVQKMRSQREAEGNTDAALRSALERSRHAQLESEERSVAALEVQRRELAAANGQLREQRAKLAQFEAELHAWREGGDPRTSAGRQSLPGGCSAVCASATETPGPRPMGPVASPWISTPAWASGGVSGSRPTPAEVAGGLGGHCSGASPRADIMPALGGETLLGAAATPTANISFDGQPIANELSSLEAEMAALNAEIDGLESTLIVDAPGVRF